MKFMFNRLSPKCPRVKRSSCQKVDGPKCRWPKGDGPRTKCGRFYRMKVNDPQEKFHIFRPFTFLQMAAQFNLRPSTFPTFLSIYFGTDCIFCNFI